MKQYHDMLKHILNNGQKKTDRTGTGTISIFGYQTRFNLEHGFPAVTTKKLYFKGVICELLWFLRGSTNIKYLVDNNVNIWNDDAYRYYLKIMNDIVPHPDCPKEQDMSKEEFVRFIKNNSEEKLKRHVVDNYNVIEIGTLGKIYGAQWRSWETYDEHGCLHHLDQIKGLIRGLKENPDSRRHVLSAWNVGELEEMSLMPCHVLAQFYVSNDKKLSCQVFQRSADSLLGVPFNIASYALLTHMLAQVCDLGVSELVYTIGDAHIYNNHIEQAKEQLSREPLELPKLWLNPEIKDIDGFKYEDIKLVDYKSYSTIKAPLSVGA